MRTIKSLFTIILAVALWSSCGVGDGSKPLVGGIRDRENTSGQTFGEAGKSRRMAVDDNEKQSGDTGKGQCGDAVNALKGAGFTGLPALSAHLPEQILRRTGYVVSYNKDTKLPNWVAWHLTAERIKGTSKRPVRAFHEDEDVPSPRAVDFDYYNSGYDRGHMCPAADNKMSDEAMLESFLFTNICPQNHNLNIGDWNEMENLCRNWARKYGDIYIVCGPILYKGRHKRIGKNKVVVPEAFFKVVLCLTGKPKAIGFVYKNVSGDRPTGDYVNTVDEVERITGFDFFSELPDDVEKVIEADCSLSDW